MTPLVQIRALLSRLQSGVPLSETEAERLALEALSLQRRLERLREVAPEVEVELHPMLVALADRGRARLAAERGALARLGAVAPGL